MRMPCSSLMTKCKTARRRAPRPTFIVHRFTCSSSCSCCDRRRLSCSSASPLSWSSSRPPWRLPFLRSLWRSLFSRPSWRPPPWRPPVLHPPWSSSLRASWRRLMSQHPHRSRHRRRRESAWPAPARVGHESECPAHAHELHRLTHLLLQSTLDSENELVVFIKTARSHRQAKHARPLQPQFLQAARARAASSTN